MVDVVVIVVIIVVVVVILGEVEVILFRAIIIVALIIVVACGLTLRGPWSQSRWRTNPIFGLVIVFARSVKHYLPSTTSIDEFVVDFR